MKKSAWIIAIICLTTTACSTQKQATSTVSDDVYYSAKRGEQPIANTIKPQTKGAQVITSPDTTNVQKSNSSSFADDYNDYSYAGRINRFSSKDTTKGYFDETYTNGSSNSNGGGNNPDVNVSFGFGTGYGGFYNSPYYFGSGWGYPYSNWGWDFGFGYPYSGWGWNYGWGSPYYGWYNPWYNPCCYCYGYNDWNYGGYPPYYNTNTYYGSRKSMYRVDGGGNALNSRNSSNPSNGNVNLNDRSRVTPNYSRNSVQPSTRVVPANQEKYRYTRPVNNRQTIYQRSSVPNQVQNQNQTQRQQPTPRYIRPENVTPAQRSVPAQSYSSPVYRLSLIHI